MWRKGRLAPVLAMLALWAAAAGQALFQGAGRAGWGEPASEGMHVAAALSLPPVDQGERRAPVYALLLGGFFKLGPDAKTLAVLFQTGLWAGTILVMWLMLRPLGELAAGCWALLAVSSPLGAQLARSPVPEMLGTALVWLAVWLWTRGWPGRLAAVAAAAGAVTALAPAWQAAGDSWSWPGWGEALVRSSGPVLMAGLVPAALASAGIARIAGARLPARTGACLLAAMMGLQAGWRPREGSARLWLAVLPGLLLLAATGWHSLTAMLGDRGPRMLRGVLGAGGAAALAALQVWLTPIEPDSGLGRAVAQACETQLAPQVLVVTDAAGWNAFRAELARQRGRCRPVWSRAFDAGAAGPAVVVVDSRYAARTRADIAALDWVSEHGRSWPVQAVIAGTRRTLELHRAHAASRPGHP
jgi:hypothetical protein